MIASKINYDKKRRYIFSLKQSNTHSTGNKWRLKYDKQKEYYLISNHEYPNEYLYFDSYLDKTQTLNVFLSSDKDLVEAYSELANKWILVSQKDGYFYIKNLFRKEYLYEFYYDFDTNGHQYAFVSKNTTLWSKLNTDKRKWKIK